MQQKNFRVADSGSDEAPFLIETEIACLMQNKWVINQNLNQRNIKFWSEFDFLSDSNWDSESEIFLVWPESQSDFDQTPTFLIYTLIAYLNQNKESMNQSLCNEKYKIVTNLNTV